jgi:FkbH-like protein
MQQMKLIEALEIVRRPANQSAPGRTVFLACGFTPLHLETFLAAQLRLLFPDVRFGINTGLFGDLAGSIERLDRSGIDALAVAIEWSDIDPRLGIRALGRWPADLTEIVQSAEQAVERLESALTNVSGAAPTVVCMPTLPLPPMFSTRPLQTGSFETALHRMVATLAESLSRKPGLRIVNAQLLAEASAPTDRYDLKSDLSAGFPYTLRHAGAVGRLLAELIQNRPPMKGLITDLDDTLWAGILGEAGIDGISWHLDRHTHMHGLYQQCIASLAKAGTLVAVASKNDPNLVAAAFERSDLLVSRNDIFPIEAHWSRKSESVQRILDAWNIDADSVIFVDDSPMEVAEVKAAFPAMDCRVFPKGDDNAIFELLKMLRDAFGKQLVTEEDSLRLSSLRSTGERRTQEQSANVSADDFLRSADATIVFDTCAADDTRAFELINKTNQFNLNGRRLTETQWRNFFNDPRAFLLSVTYKDKYGPLGKIAVILGRRHGNDMSLDHWVMSCRAFSRRIEHQCLTYLFESMGAQQIAFAYEATLRNGPLQGFLAEFLTAAPQPGVHLTKELFSQRVPPLFHRVEVALHV